MAAVHSFTAPPPRPLYLFLDLVRIARHGANFDSGEAVAAARRWGAALPVAVACSTADRLWPGTACGDIATRLERDLRATELVVGRRSRTVRGADPSMGWLVLARLMAGRSSRHGWLSVLRRAWPHAAQVEIATPAALPMWRRRLQWTLGRRSADEA